MYVYVCMIMFIGIEYMYNAREEYVVLSYNSSEQQAPIDKAMSKNL